MGMSFACTLSKYYRIKLFLLNQVYLSVRPVPVWFKNIGVDKCCLAFSCKAKEVKYKCTPLLRKKALDKKACGYLNPDKKEESPFKDCILESPSTSKKMLENCLFDFCSYIDDPPQMKKSVCQSITGFADFCGSMGITAQWRDESFCRTYQWCIYNLAINTLIRTRTREKVSSNFCNYIIPSAEFSSITN